MARLGEFGAALKELDADAERDDFLYFGERFVIAASIPPILMFELAATMTGKYEEVRGLASMWQALHVSLGDEQYEEFRGLSVQKRGDLRDLMELTFAIYQADGGRPTVQPSGSSDGLPTTSPSSSTSSTHPALAHLKPVSEVLAG
jgi:hypothetical protein